MKINTRPRDKDNERNVTDQSASAQNSFIHPFPGINQNNKNDQNPIRRGGIAHTDSVGNEKGIRTPVSVDEN